MKFASNYDELATLVASNLCFARSSSDFIDLISRENVPEHLARSHGIFKRIPKEKIVNFSRTLEFKDGMIGHANYSHIEDYLDDYEKYTIWEIFAVGEELSKRSVDYYCKIGSLDEPKKCVSSSGSYCGELICRN